ncbi:Hypothetical predicted protein [Cloeon dipterum]|uniref:Uncharacterized protein n=1 Tax=Cloeon dipterum TaxID=197152 RepID=A0A8S1BZY5_9INSE|nr:Hypothetical predicted protein [Cloeon dipterum]
MVAFLAKLSNKLLPQGDSLNLWRKFVLFIAIIQFFTFNIVCAVAHKGGFNGGKIGIFILPIALFLLIFIIGISCVQVIKMIGKKTKNTEVAGQGDAEAGPGIGPKERPTAVNGTENIDEPPAGIVAGWT